MNIGLSTETREFVARNLNALLADQYVLQTKLLKYHWNVRGAHFGPLHGLFQKGYELMYKTTDDTAERVVQLGHYAYGSLHEFSTFSRIKEMPGHNPIALEMIKDLVRDCELVITQIRELVNHTDSNYRDMATNNFLCDLMQEIEKYAWLLRAHIE